MQAIIEAARKRTAEVMAKQVSSLPSSADIQMEAGNSLINSAEVITNSAIKMYGFDPYTMDGGIVLNDRQREAVDRFGIKGESGCLIGPAGSGKTMTTKAIMRAAIMSGRIPTIPRDAAHKYMPTGTPGIWGGSFTRIATRNLRDQFPVDLQDNVHTIHRLLEYEPQFQDVTDEKTGVTKSIRIFKPTRTAMRTIDEAVKMFVIDESSMVGTTLYNNLVNAVGCDRPQFIYIGDIAQLPPVMDDSVLGYRLLDSPVVELTEVYRHAGVIVELANHIRVGKTIPDSKLIIPYYGNLRKMPRKLAEEGIAKWNRTEDGSKVNIHLWKNRIEGDTGVLRVLGNLSKFFKGEIDSGAYIPNEHMILIPYNKLETVGAIELNKVISQYIGYLNKAEVYEVIAGFQKHYYAVGDKVFFDREEALITKISRNGLYQGKLPQLHSVTLDRWGHNQAGQAQTLDNEEMDSIDSLLNISVDGDDEERKNQSSHVITVKKLGDIADFGDRALEYKASTASEVNNLLFGYALTIHKSQGSQWPKVYCIFHNSHNRNLQRELLYTAITRAQKELYVICEPETFIQGVTSQHIVGNTLAQKAEYFKGKKLEKDRRNEIFNGQ